MIKKIKQRKLLLLLTGMFIGGFIILQSHSFEVVTDDYSRENKADVFQEIKILKDKNKDLSTEVLSLETTLESLSDQNSALKAIEEEINKYKKLTGNFPVYGSGVSVTVKGTLTIPLAIDLVNELLNSGAEAVSINSIRITNNTAGFDSMPQQKILINDAPLSSPYVFEAIGEPAVLERILTLPGGILSRMKTVDPGLDISLERRDVVQMN